MRRLLSSDSKERDWQIALYEWLAFVALLILTAIFKPEWWR